MVSSPTEPALVEPTYNAPVITARVIRNMTTIKSCSFLLEICKQQQKIMAALKYGLFQFGFRTSNVHVNRHLGLTAVPVTANSNINSLTANKGKLLKRRCQ